MQKDWRNKTALAAKHARLVQREPGLREALYGASLTMQAEILRVEAARAEVWRMAMYEAAGVSSEQLFPATRETAKKETS